MKPITDKQKEDWINRTDSDLNIETWEEFFPNDDDIDFSTFYDSYNKKHLKKYGNKLLINFELWKQRKTILKLNLLVLINQSEERK